MSNNQKTSISYSMLNAIGYKRGVGEDPRLARASTTRDLQELADGTLGDELAHKSRLFKAIEYLKSKSFKPVPDMSTIKEVVMQSKDGVQAVATSRGEAIINNRLDKRFLNG